MEKIKLNIIGISNSQTQTGAYALILGEEEGQRRLPIIIGGFEAQSIAIEMENMHPNRPLTHDLFRNFAQAFNISLTEVIINKFEEGVFYAQLICHSDEGRQVIDSRTSDAIALAVRFKCPVYTYEEVMSAAGILIEEENKEEAKQESRNNLEDIDEKTEFQRFTLDELKQLLNEAVAKEEFERASQLRDEIRRREEQQQ
ncbi:MAG: bifunctional nuclease domain-containing protein [Bacteroidales bacterium]